MTLGAALREPPEAERGENGNPAVNGPGRFGHFELIEELGRGGAGVVFKARDTRLNRLVALKLIRDERLSSELELARFQAEAEIAATLSHPNIVTVYEVGELQGRPFISMELLEGGTLHTEAGTAAPQAHKTGGLRAAAAIVVKLARAVHYAHRRGVLHRDLKPGNVLLDDQGEPHIADFGLARQLENSRALTLSGSIVGTPGYLSPEQAAGERESTTATDVYGLGALLYKLLTGRAVFSETSTVSTLMKVRHQEPENPELINPAVDRELATICLKCLEKEAGRRYASAADLADDLDRWLQGKPIAARPVKTWERAMKWSRRNPITAGLAAALLAALLAGAVGVLSQWRRAELNAQLEAEARRNAEGALTRLRIRTAQSALESGDTGTALALLARTLREDPYNAVAAQRLISLLAHYPFAVPGGAFIRSTNQIRSAQFDPEGARIVTASFDGMARVWNVQTGLPLTPPLGHHGPVCYAEFSPDGLRVVTASQDATARIWDAATGLPLTLPLPHDGIVWRAQFSADGKRVVTASEDQTARVWDARTGKPITPALAHGAKVTHAEFSPDSSTLATACGDGSARLWHATTGRLIAVLGHRRSVQAARFSRDGRFVVTASEDGTAQVWDANDGISSGVTIRHPHGSELYWASFSPDGQRIVTVAGDGSAQVWETSTGEPVTPPLRHAAVIWFACFSPDGGSVATACSDGTARIWEASTGRSLSERIRHGNGVWELTFHPDGRRLLTASEDGTARVWRLPRIRQWVSEFRHQDRLTDVQFSPDGSRAVTCSADSTARVWDLKSGQTSAVFTHSAKILKARFSPDGERLVTASGDGSARVWNVRTGEPVTDPLCHDPAFQVNDAVFDSEGRRVATASWDGTARVWNALTGQPLTPPLRHEGHVMMIEFSTDGRKVATASDDDTARLWDAATGEALVEPLRHNHMVASARFNPEGTHLITTSADKTARIWEISSGRELHVLRHATGVFEARYSPDGLLVATATLTRARIWNAGTGRSATPPLEHKGRVWDLEFSHDGRRLATASRDGTARVWDVATGHQVAGPFGDDDYIRAARFSPDGRLLLTASRSGLAQLWPLPEAPVPVPQLIVDLAEALAGERMELEGFSETVLGDELWFIRARVMEEDGSSDYYSTWLRPYLVTEP